MWKNGVEIDEKSCTVYLVEVMRCENLILGLVFYDKTVECGIDVFYYFYELGVDGLCKNGEVRKGMELVEEGVVKGVRPNVITFNTLIDACKERSKVYEKSRGYLANLLIMFTAKGFDSRLQLNVHELDFGGTLLDFIHKLIAGMDM
ncbi:pentatricopeptide repeat-containing protein [Tanacetum coccineum]|uniref:Pentatricopeptide repeat-containing protein n=1 Tax=Tanacetum coccineum TaxID=301880 RepID=A0ABQ4YZ43_9ASTR